MADAGGERLLSGELVSELEGEEPASETEMGREVLGIILAPPGPPPCDDDKDDEGRKGGGGGGGM